MTIPHLLVLDGLAAAIQDLDLDSAQLSGSDPQERVVQ